MELHILKAALVLVEENRVHYTEPNSSFLLVRKVAHISWSHVCKVSKCHYYTSDSLWKIGLVESIQSIRNSLWTWHDKRNICCRYCIYHIKFNVCLVTKPLGVYSSETKWLNASLLFLRINFVKNVKNCVICLSLRLRQITQTSVLIIHVWYHAQPHPIIVY